MAWAEIDGTSSQVWRSLESCNVPVVGEVEHGGITGQGLSSTLLLARTGAKGPPMKDLTTALGHVTQTKVLGTALLFLGAPDQLNRAAIRVIPGHTQLPGISVLEWDSHQAFPINHQYFILCFSRSLSDTTV